MVEGEATSSGNSKSTVGGKADSSSTVGEKATSSSSSSSSGAVWMFLRSLGGEIEFLHRSYVGRLWYWEVVETLRRLMLTAVLSVVAVGSSAQTVFGLFIALVFMKVRLSYARTVFLVIFSRLIFSLLTCRLRLLVIYLHSLSSSLWCL